MIINVIKKQKRVLIQYSLGLFLVLGLAILIVTSLLQYKINEVKKSELLKSEQNIVGVENTIIFNKINDKINDIIYCLYIKLEEIGFFSLKLLNIKR